GFLACSRSLGTRRELVRTQLRKPCRELPFARCSGTRRGASVGKQERKDCKDRRSPDRLARSIVPRPHRSSASFGREQPGEPCGSLGEFRSPELEPCSSGSRFP